MATITIDNIALAEPVTYNVTYKDVDSENAYTSETGHIVRDVVRFDQTNIAVGWEKLDEIKAKTIIKAMSGKPNFQVRYYDEVDFSYKTKTFYAFDRKITTERLSSRVKRFKIDVELIEV